MVRVITGKEETLTNVLRVAEPH